MGKSGVQGRLAVHGKTMPVRRRLSADRLGGHNKQANPKKTYECGSTPTLSYKPRIRRVIRHRKRLTQAGGGGPGVSTGAEPPQRRFHKAQERLCYVMVMPYLAPTH